jgi:hypothetical protein
MATLWNGRVLVAGLTNKLGRRGRTGSNEVPGTNIRAGAREAIGWARSPHVREQYTHAAAAEFTHDLEVTQTFANQVSHGIGHGYEDSPP